MKIHFKLLYCFLLIAFQANAQTAINDEALRYQQQRMVFQQWDQNKFKPTPGFLDLNPYYWLTWGLFYPDYHKTDLRPLGPTGPQTQRLALVATLNNVDKNYKLQSDTIRNTALSQIASQSGALSGADPLWVLYYKDEFKPVLNKSMASLLAGLSPQAGAKLVSEGTYSWYDHELDMLAQRINTAHSTDMDRGSRILAYYRLLKNYRQLAGVWAIRTSTVEQTLKLTAQQQNLKSGTTPEVIWVPHSDIEIANQVLLHMQ